MDNCQTFTKPWVLTKAVVVVVAVVVAIDREA